ncbi:MAG: hypothetical protein JO283_21720 [Bradyrhizobium sp.]|nr:hypothetical protein [Bradyrhizobium sp.]
MSFVRRITKHAARTTPNKNRSFQAKPNCVCKRMSQTVPSAMTSATGLSTIRAANRHNHPNPEMIDKARQIHSKAAVRALKAATVAGSRVHRNVGEAMSKSKKTMPATIIDEP